MAGDDKKLKIEAIKEMVEAFCEPNLHSMYKEYILHLCDVVRRKDNLNIMRGKNEIWAAALIHAIARLNFLYDDAQPDGHRITLDVLCEFFQTKKPTIVNKANLITKACDIRIGQPEYSRPEVADMAAFHATQEGFVINKSTAGEITIGGISEKEIVVEFLSEEESEEIERFMAEQKRREEEKLRQKKARRLEINRKIAEKKRGKKLKRDEKQMGLFGDD